MGGCSMTERRIISDACVAEGAEWLSRAEPRFAAVLPKIGPLDLRLRPQGFAELMGAIVSQQVSVAAARAIGGRLLDAGMDDPQCVQQAGEDDLRALGLSRQKVRYIRALAEADIDYGRLGGLPTPDVVRELTAVPGIGVWTAEIYAMFSLGRADVLAAGDLALQEGARLIFALPERPNERALRGLAAAWSPWRSVAARIIWAYYKYEKDREGIG